MKPMILSIVALVSAAFLLTGCGQSSSNSSETAKNSPASSPAASPDTTPAAAPAAAPSLVTVTSDVQKVATAPDSTSTVAAQAGSDQVSQFAASAAGQSDQTAASIGNELAAKANSLAQSAQGNPDVKTQIGGALQSLSAGKDANALTTLFQEAKQANLTPQQTQLVKEVSNLASAYVVQRNFSSLSGAQGDVATIVDSLRKGSYAPALPALKSLAQNASLTPQQKDLLGTLTDQYAPGLKKATDSLKQGLQTIPGFNK